jgi:hypothetical protein
MLAFLCWMTEKLDDQLRIMDFRAQRTVGGPLQRLCNIRRHTAAALILPALLCALLILGSPSASRTLWALVTVVFVLAGLISFMRMSDWKTWPIKLDLLVQSAVMTIVAGLVWGFGADQYQDHGLYRHALVPIAAALVLSLLCGAIILGPIFRRIRTGKYSHYLRVTELFASRGSKPVVTFWTVVVALFTAPFRAPLLLLTPTAIVTLLATPVWIGPAAIITVSICFFALFVAGLNERFGVMWDLIQAVFFKAGALLVSVVIIVLAAARLAGITYVTTVFDTAAWWTIGLMLAFAYIASWWYDYWSNRLVTDEVLRMLDPGALGVAQIPYLIDKNHVATSVPFDQRVLQIHGASRFVVIRERPNEAFPYFQTYSVDDLIGLLAVTGAPGGKALPTPMQVRGRLYNLHVIAALVFVAVTAIVVWTIHNGLQLSEATLRNQTGTVKLTDMLRRSNLDPKRPLIVVAASGGGTRAAVYTASVLEGISKLGRSGDVVLTSGVSGGGAALAYFAANRPGLITNDAATWDKYFDVMSQPYIQDVLNRSSEWRITTAGRLGLLLKESFDRRWDTPPTRTNLAQISDIGLIFNTTLAGEFVCPKPDCGGQPLLQVERDLRSETKSTLAGGRLLLTNLDLPPGITGKPLEPGSSEPLPIVLSGAQISLQQAAALNANFPPVFSNAAIDVDNQKRYWVTDGGAADNRGMEMMLYAVRVTLQNMLQKIGPDALPPIYIVVADASAFSDAYTQDRGISSMEGAGSHFASHLDSELVSSIQQLYCLHPERFHFTYVMMPDRLRQSGSFGTHWMLQSHITVRRPDTAAKNDPSSVTITGEEMVAVLRALHSPGFHGQLSTKACTVLQWGYQDTSHTQAWTEFITQLGGSNSRPDCTAP